MRAVSASTFPDFILKYKAASEAEAAALRLRRLDAARGIVLDTENAKPLHFAWLCSMPLSYVASSPLHFTCVMLK